MPIKPKSEAKQFYWLLHYGNDDGVISAEDAKDILRRHKICEKNNIPHQVAVAFIFTKSSDKLQFIKACKGNKI